MSILFFSGLVLAIPPRTDPNDAFAEIENDFVLHFYNAMTGAPIKDAQIGFQGTTLRTKADGTVRFPFPKDLNNSEDTRSVHFSKSGFTTTDFDVKFQVGSLWFNRFSVSPEVPLKKLRVVLDWGTHPRDLDAHLVREGSYHISYRQKRTIVDHANLDRDDRDGEGAETITIHKISPNATYRFYVHDYTNQQNPQSTKLSESGARIHIFSNNGRDETFYVPTQEQGTTWNVFRIENGKIVPEQSLR